MNLLKKKIGENRGTKPSKDNPVCECGNILSKNREDKYSMNYRCSKCKKWIVIKKEHKSKLDKLIEQIECLQVELESYKKWRDKLIEKREKEKKHTANGFYKHHIDIILQDLKTLKD